MTGHDRIGTLAVLGIVGALAGGLVPAGWLAEHRGGFALLIWGLIGAAAALVVGAALALWRKR